MAFLRQFWAPAISNRNSSSRRRASRRRPNFETLEGRELLTTVVFGDAFEGGWQDWSWNTVADFANTSPVDSGNNSVSAEFQQAWAGLYLANPTPIDASELAELRFSIHGGNNNNGQMRLFVVDGNENWLDAGEIRPVADQWTNVVVDLQPLGATNTISGLVWQETTGGPQSTFYLDEVAFWQATGPDNNDEPVSGPSITIDPTNEIRTINDGIYGLNFADEQFADEIDLDVNRWGGNSTTRYNYQNDTFNTASDWFFENIPNDVDNLAQLPAGSSADRFVEQNNRSGTDTIMTVGTIGWTPKSRDIVGGFSVNKYGPQQELDPWRPEFGNGVALDGSFITGNNPTDTSIPVDEQFAADWIEHLTDQFGTAAEGGVKYYALDNEPMLWNYTHRDVHPEPASYDEVLGKGVTYATAIKQADPAAQVLGPTAWGWTGYFYSALDAAGEGAWWENPQDQNAHGGVDFIPWYLSEMAAAEQQTGTRLLDYLDIHYYPQTDGVALSAVGDATTQRERLKSTRSLWDPTYVDNSWIDESVHLIPRMRDWIDANYPGTGLAITEYNFGGVEHINGAITQADVLGIFGREGVDLATMWAPPAPNEPAAFAFRMFRNYDGQQQPGSKFGNVSVSASTSNVDQVAVFAAERSEDDALTVMLINKSADAMVTPITVAADYQNAVAEIYSYDATNLGKIVRGEDIQLTGGSVSIVLPASSITLLELGGANIETDIVSVNLGEQSSTVRSIEVNFSQPVTMSDEALLIEHVDGRGNTIGVVDSISTLSPTANGSRAVITFQGNLTEFDSLIDGRYRLTVRGDQIQVGDLALEADVVEEFYRLFGDRNGDTVVNRDDAMLLSAAFRAEVGDENFDVGFDFDNDGVIAELDAREFVTRARR